MASPKQQQLLRDAHGLLLQQQWGSAEALVTTALAKGKPTAQALLMMGIAKEGLGEPEQAESFGRRALSLEPLPDTMLLLARMAKLRGDTDEAVTLCDRALRVLPGDGRAMLIKASALEQAGRFDEARAIVGPMVEDAETAHPALAMDLRYEWAKLLVQSGEHKEAVALLRSLIDNPATPAEIRRMQWHLVAKSCDRHGDYTGAWDAATEANAIDPVPFDPDAYARQIDALLETWSASNLPDFPRSSCVSEKPVFIAGMPRSGTSLLDQIIAAHPEASGVGELATVEAFGIEFSMSCDLSRPAPERFGSMDGRRFTRVADKYVQQIERMTSRSCRRIANKALTNDKMLGLISRLFPKTRVIHVVRDPRDVAVSCYMGGFNNSRFPWTARAEWAAAAWQQSERLMQHWTDVLAVPILTVHYERLVREPAIEFRRVVEFLGLEWDPACLEFHSIARTVRTLSYDQVNKPLYTSSIGRHAHYAAGLDGIDFPEYAPPA